MGKHTRKEQTVTNTKQYRAKSDHTKIITEVDLRDSVYAVFTTDNGITYDQMYLDLFHALFEPVPEPETLPIGTYITHPASARSWVKVGEDRWLIIFGYKAAVQFASYTDAMFREQGYVINIPKENA